MLNVYPYFSFINNKNYISSDYALSRSTNPVPDGSLECSSLFDASIDALAYAMEKEGFQGLQVVVSKIGWPTNDGEAGSVENAVAYNGYVVS